MYLQYIYRSIYRRIQSTAAVLSTCYSWNGPISPWCGLLLSISIGTKKCRAPASAEHGLKMANCTHLWHPAAQDSITRPLKRKHQSARMIFLIFFTQARMMLVLCIIMHGPLHAKYMHEK